MLSVECPLRARSGSSPIVVILIMLYGALRGVGELSTNPQFYFSTLIAYFAPEPLRNISISGDPSPNISIHSECQVLHSENFQNLGYKSIMISTISSPKYLLNYNYCFHSASNDS